ncbi:MAG: MEDS domain-containing protein, partial [Chloroflexota bacterium]
MEKVLRKSGIKIIGDIPWGTHLSLFYHNPGDLINVMVPYFRSGLTANELCLWIVSEPLTTGDAAVALRRSVTDLDRYLESGQMSIIPCTEWYLKENIFDPGEVARRWRDRLEKATAGGYDGLRVTGDTAWLQPEDWASFMEYEEELGEITDRMLCICTYSLERCQPCEVIDIVSRHQFSLVKRDGKWDCIERQKYNLMEHALKKRVKELRCLYDIASISGEPYLTLRERFDEIVELLTRAMQYPEIAFARITLNGENFNTGNYRKTDYRASADIIVNGAKAGVVEVGYIKAPPLTENGRFSKEERLLLDAVAERLGTIAEHRQAEEALRESEEKFSKAFRFSPAIVAITKLKTGEFLEFNDSFVRFSGYTRKELIGNSGIGLDFWLNADDRSKVVGMIKEKGKVHNEEFKFRTKSGEIRTLLISVEPINFIGEECLIFVSMDVSERKRAEEEIKESENKYRSLFEGMLNGFAYCKILVDENNNPVDFIYLEVNDAFERLTGLKRKDVVGKKVTEAIPDIK